MGTVATVGRLLVSLAVVLGLMWVIARRMRRPARGRSSRLIDVLGRQQLTRSSSVTLVRVLDQALILGVSDGRVSVLGEADLATARAHLADGAEADGPRATRGAATTVTTAPTAPTATAPSRPAGALAGSALSAGTWRQTVEAMRDLTARRR